MDDFIQILYTKWIVLAYLQEMSTLFGEMSANQVRTVHGFSHVCLKSSKCTTNKVYFLWGEGGETPRTMLCLGVINRRGYIWPPTKNCNVDWGKIYSKIWARCLVKYYQGLQLESRKRYFVIVNCFSDSKWIRLNCSWN